MTAGDWDGAAYGRISRPQKEWGARVLERVALRGDELALDGGCGAGAITAQLADRLPRGRVLAVDRSQPMLLEARSALARFGSRVQLLRGDLSTLALGRPLDLILSTATLHWIADHPRLFANLLRLLAPGGRLVAQYGGQGNLARLLARVAAWIAQPAHAAYFAGYRDRWQFDEPVTTRSLLERVGFTAIAASLTPAPARFDDAATFREFVAKVVLREHLALLPAPLSAALLDAQCAAAAGDDPPFTLDYVRIDLDAARPA